ncbi:MAG: hypothetical protein QNI84_15485 [Henriciella sp.]|nr:hypothetical protein [Henriciella sp.]
MTEMVLEFGLRNAIEEDAFARAVYAFVARSSEAGASDSDKDAPDVMIKTVCSPDGTMKKAVTFQDKDWARAFMDFWHRSKREAA